MKISSTVTIDAKKSPKELSKYIKDAFMVNKAYFPALTEKDFKEWLISKTTSRNKIQIYKNKEGVCIGFNAVRFYEMQNNDSVFIVVSPYCFIAKDYRGNSIIQWFTFKECVAVRFNDIKTPMFLITRTTIFSYHAAVKNTFTMYPLHNQTNTPENILVLINIMCKKFKMKKISKENPFLVKGLDFLMEKKDKNSWRARQDEKDIAYYIKQTDLVTDTVILIVIPLALSDVLANGCKILWNLTNKRIFRHFSNSKTKGKVTPIVNEEEKELKELKSESSFKFPSISIGHNLYDDSEEEGEKLQDDSQTNNGAFEIIEIKETKPRKHHKTNVKNLRACGDCFFKTTVQPTSKHQIDKETGSVKAEHNPGDVATLTRTNHLH